MGSDYTSVTKPDAEVVHGATGSGWPLVEYQGKWICKACKRRLENESVSLESAKKHEKEDSFRSRAGFQRP